MERAPELTNLRQVRVGLAAPLFAAEAYVAGEDGPRTIALADLRGSWVALLFYRRDFAAACATQLHTFAALARELSPERAVLVAASTDGYLCHRAWFESHPLLGDVAFPVIADPAHRLASAYGVLCEDGSARRASFLVDPHGTVAHASLPEHDQTCDPEELLLTLRRLRRA